MGFQKKTGKGRLDKYYHLAKEQGYRARSAFKLIQLNKKYNFLSSARTLIDLCAAPGGWLQVAQKYMPVSSLIIGVDLVPIKPIPKVITFAEDITTDKCRNRLRQEMKTWKADVVLHDGAPNVGSNWNYDAYTQSELVLMSLKLATEFLHKGGTFVTKVFRSKDYNSLIWVLNQLFRKVEATKPPSSRNVSAEIFVVCQDFIAPKKLDPRFLDAKYVFEELMINKSMTSTDIFAPELKKKKRHREGYDDNDYTLHKKIDAMEFIKSRDPAGTIGTANEMVFDDEESKDIVKLPETTEEILLACKDLKVLGKRDFRILMKWRAKLRERYQLEKSESEGKPSVNDNEEGSGDDTGDELDALAAGEKRKVRKERKKKNEKRQKNLIKMQLNMTTPSDIGMEQAGESLFESSNAGKSAPDLAKIRSSNIEDIDVDGLENPEELVPLGGDGNPSDGNSSADEDSNSDDGMSSDDDRLAALESQIDNMYDAYVEHRRERDAKYDIKKKRASEGEFRGFSDDEGKGSGSDDSSGESDNAAESEMSDSDEDEEIRSMMREAKASKKNKTKAGRSSDVADDNLSGKSAMWFDQPLFKGVGGVDLSNITDSEDGEEEGSGDEYGDDVALGSKRKRSVVSEGKRPKSQEAGSESDDDFELASASDDGDPNDVRLEAEAREADYDLATPEAMTMMRDLANRKTSKEDLLDKHFNRYTFSDTKGLPDWFADDEQKHNKPMLPVTKEAVRMLREKLKALDARPIKKVAEAKARKKMRASQRVAKMQKKAESVIANDDMTEAEKARSIDRMIKRATKAKPKQKIQLVVAKNSNRGLKGRPKGVKGKYKMVDARMKKDLRAQKARDKRSKKSRR